MLKTVRWMTVVAVHLGGSLPPTLGCVLATGCSGRSAADAADHGALSMSLLAVANGATYRLSSVQLYITGPQQYYPYYGENNPNESKISIDQLPLLPILNSDLAAERPQAICGSFDRRPHIQK